MYCTRKTTRFVRLLSPVLAFWAVASVAPHASAYPSYPYTVAAELDMSCTPQCSLCHTTNPGRADNAKQDFIGSFLADASKAVEDDVKSGDEKALAKALALLGDKDTDGDGFSDVAELQASPPSDPNSATLTPDAPGDGMCAAELRYGCGAQIASSSPQSNGFGGWWAGLSLLVAVMLVRRGRTQASR